MEKCIPLRGISDKRSYLSSRKKKIKIVRGKRHLPLSKSAMRPTRNKSIMRLAIVFFRFASGVYQSRAMQDCSDDTSRNEAEGVTGFETQRILLKQVRRYSSNNSRFQTME